MRNCYISLHTIFRVYIMLGCSYSIFNINIFICCPSKALFIFFWPKGNTDQKRGQCPKQINVIHELRSSGVVLEVEDLFSKNNANLDCLYIVYLFRKTTQLY